MELRVDRAFKYLEKQREVGDRSEVVQVVGVHAGFFQDGRDCGEFE